MLEDCFEIGVFLRRKEANYSATEGDGHLYVLSKQRLVDSGLKVVDLASISLADCRPRFHSQAAWLVGPLRGNLPVATIETHITAPAAAFRAYAAAKGITETARVFPNSAEDPVLATLLALPWERIRLPEDKNSKFDMPFYHRALELPEYFREGYRKIMPSHYAFYDSSSITDGLPDGHGIYVHQVNEVAMYGHAEVTMQFPRVAAMLEQHSNIAFEVDALVRLPESGPAIHYSKGISVMRIDDGTISIGDLVVDHPGRQITGVGVNAGWHYIVDQSGTWSRVKHADECPCPNTWRHEQHLSALTIIDHLLAEQLAETV